MSAPAPTDTCPECISPERSVTVRCYLTEPAPLGSIRGYYRCPECGHRWNACWLTSALEFTAKGDAA